MNIAITVKISRWLLLRIATCRPTSTLMMTFHLEDGRKLDLAEGGRRHQPGFDRYLQPALRREVGEFLVGSCICRDLNQQRSYAFIHWPLPELLQCWMRFENSGR